MDKDEFLFEFTINDEEKKEKRSIPIPPRTIDTVYSPKIKKDFLTPFSMGYTKNNQSYYYTFLKYAEEYADRKNGPVEFVPFKAYWPTFDAMSEGQINWYFYWRDMIRHGVFIDTDLSYIFLYVYEIINEVGISSKTDGYIKLCGLWSNYRIKYPKLDNYLVDWIFDYIFINKLDIDIDNIIKILDDKILLYLNADVLLSFYVRKPIKDLPLTLLKILSDYKLDDGALFKCGKYGFFIEKIYKVLECLENKLCDEGEFLIEKFNPERYDIKQRFPYKSALYAGSTNVINITVTSFTNVKKLRSFITGCIKFTENSLRKKFGIKGKLRVDADDKLIKLFEECLRLSDKGIKKVAIDNIKLNKLADESDELRDKLILTDDYDDASDIIAIRTNELDKAENPIEDSIVNTSDLEDYEVAALKVLLSGINVNEELRNISERNNIMYEIMLDNINEKLIGYLGDIAIDTTLSVPVILDDYAEAVKSLINN